RVIAGANGLDVAIRGELEIGDGGRAAQHAHGTIRTGVIVDRRALSVFPAKHPEMIPPAGTPQDTLIRRLPATEIVGQVVSVRFQAFELPSQLAQRRTSIERIQVADKS